MEYEDVGVVVLLPATGRAPFLIEQIESIAKQVGVQPEIHLLLNGYRGPSEAQLHSAAGSVPLVIYRHFQALGLPAAYFDLLTATQKSPSDLFAYCDQDDIWHPEKLFRAAAALRSISGPALWVSAREITHPDTKERQVITPPLHWGMEQSSVACLAPGCSMVFNTGLRDLLMPFTRSHQIVMHDWLTAVIATARGTVVVDDRPALTYRLHDGQTLGHRRSLPLRFIRLIRATRGHSPTVESQSRALVEAWCADDAHTPLQLVLLSSGSATDLIRACRNNSLNRPTRLGNVVLPWRLALGKGLNFGSVTHGRSWLMPRPRT